MAAVEEVLRALSEALAKRGEARVKLYYRQDVGFLVFIYGPHISEFSPLFWQLDSAEEEELLKRLDADFSTAVIDSDSEPAATGQEMTLLVRPRQRPVAVVRYGATQR